MFHGSVRSQPSHRIECKTWVNIDLAGPCCEAGQQEHLSDCLTRQAASWSVARGCGGNHRHTDNTNGSTRSALNVTRLTVTSLGFCPIRSYPPARQSGPVCPDS